MNQDMKDLFFLIFEILFYFVYIQRLMVDH